MIYRVDKVNNYSPLRTSSSKFSSLCSPGKLVEQFRICHPDRTYNPISRCPVYRKCLWKVRKKKAHTHTHTHTHTRKVLHLEDTLLANDNNNNNNNNNSNPSFFFYDSLTRFRPKKIIIVNYVHLCSKESVRFDLYPLSLRLPSCLNDGKESHGESRLCPV